MGGGGAALGAGYRDSQDEARRGPSLYANEHGQPSVDVWNQGRWEDAEQLKVQVIETRKTKLGADHPSTLTSMANLAFTWESTGRNADAIDLLRPCVIKQDQRILGPTHPQISSNSETLLEWETRHLSINEKPN